MRFFTSELAAQLGGELVGPDVYVEGASIDSRTLVPGQLYVPIMSPSATGTSSLSTRLEAGAPAYLYRREPRGATAIMVPDTADALMRLGRARARSHRWPVVGITGSVGKTTTKDLLYGCLASSFRTSASERSFNNELGLPLTLAQRTRRRAVGGPRDGRPWHRAHQPLGRGGAARSSGS